MAKVVNLNKHRKAVCRTEKRQLADENAARFGRSRAERARQDAEAEAARKALDAHCRDKT